MREGSYFAMTTLNYQNTKYLKSVATLDELPADRGVEVAFIGCSNAGKSSALNAITNIKGLARISKTPGRTQMINFFAIDSHRRLVGFAWLWLCQSATDYSAALGSKILMRICRRDLVCVA